MCLRMEAGYLGVIDVSIPEGNVVIVTSELPSEKSRDVIRVAFSVWFETYLRVMRTRSPMGDVWGWHSDRPLKLTRKFQMRILTIAIAAVAMSGCAITSSYNHGPNGGSVHMIDGMSAGTAYRKADNLCPNGYTVLSTQGQTSVMDYIMTVECKLPTNQIASR
jgi:hypothetical protein